MGMTYEENSMKLPTVEPCKKSYYWVVGRMVCGALFQFKIQILFKPFVIMQWPGKCPNINIIIQTDIIDAYLIGFPFKIVSDALCACACAGRHEPLSHHFI